VWGIAASLAIWAALRTVIRPGSNVATGLARAGRRTLMVFGLHYCLKLVLQYTDRLGTYTTHTDGLLTWLLTAAICTASCLPNPRKVQPRVVQPT
jgi:hypothetical protein